MFTCLNIRQVHVKKLNQLTEKIQTNLIKTIRVNVEIQLNKNKYIRWQTIVKLKRGYMVNQ